MAEMKVEYIEHMGSDLLVVNAARASFGKESKLECIDDFASLEDAEDFAEKNNGTVDYDHIASDRWFGGYPVTRLSDKDANLIRFLAREGHVLPFRHPHLTLRCKAPIFVTRQLGKHQTGMTWSEESRRYITPEPEFYWPDKWRKKAENVKQGSSDEEVTIFRPEVSKMPNDPFGQRAITMKNFAEGIEDNYKLIYRNLLDLDIAPEQARMILPQNTMVTWVWTGSLLAWVHMLKLRLSADTQKETREFAQMVEDIVAEKYPVSYSALMEEMYSD